MRHGVMSSHPMAPSRVSRIVKLGHRVLLRDQWHGMGEVVTKNECRRVLIKYASCFLLRIPNAL